MAAKQHRDGSGSELGRSCEPWPPEPPLTPSHTARPQLRLLLETLRPNPA